MKKRDLYAFQRGLNLSKFEHPRVTYAINKNKRRVREVIEDMEKAVEADEEYKKFQNEREELAKVHSEKDDKGKPKLKQVPDPNKPGQMQMIYIIPGQEDEKSKYRKDLAKIEKKYAKAIEIHEEKIRKYNEEFLDDDTDYEPFMVPLDLLEAHEKCPQIVMDLIHWMVKVEE